MQCLVAQINDATQTAESTMIPSAMARMLAAAPSVSSATAPSDNAGGVVACIIGGASPLVRESVSLLRAIRNTGLAGTSTAPTTNCSIEASVRAWLMLNFRKLALVGMLEATMSAASSFPSGKMISYSTWTSCSPPAPELELLPRRRL